MLIALRGQGFVGVAKPPGIAVIPGRNETPEQSLRHAVEVELGAKVWVVHRIDRDTSGAVIFATDTETHRTLSMAFEHREVKKRYLAIVRGVPSPRSGDIHIPLHTARRGKMRPAGEGEIDALASHTHYEVLEDFGGAALVACAPHTGRQHQIRVHMRAIGTPLLHDPLYGKEDKEAPRLCLHAERVVFAPLGIDFSVPLWPDLSAVVVSLRA